MSRPAVYLPPKFAENVRGLKNASHKEQISSKVLEIAESERPKSRLYKQVSGRKYTWTARAGDWRLFCVLLEHVYDGPERIPVIPFLNVQYRSEEYQNLESVVPETAESEVLEWANAKTDAEIRSHRASQREYIENRLDL